MSMDANNKAIKLPPEWYIGFQKRSSDELPLGFMTPDGTDKAAEKRRDTVDRWAQGNSWYSHNKQATLPAQKLENKPMVGFKLGSLRAGGGSGWDSRSDAWRIQDPRGFELEIGSGNLQEILAICTVEKGEILDECIWARYGSTNILVPTEHEVYKAAISNTERMGKKFSIKDLAVGHKMTFKNGEEALYLGRVFAYGRDLKAEVPEEKRKPRNYYSSYYPTYELLPRPDFKIYNDKPIHAYVMYRDGKLGDTIYLKNSMTIAEVSEGETLTKEEAIARANAMIDKGKHVDHPDKWGRSYYECTKILALYLEQPVGNVNYTYELDLLGDMDTVKKTLSTSRRVIVELNGEYGIVDFNPRNSGTYNSHHPLSGTPRYPFDISGEEHTAGHLIDKDELLNNHKVVRLEQAVKGFYGRGEEPVKLDWRTCNPDDIRIYQLSGKYVGLDGKPQVIDVTAL